MTLVALIETDFIAKHFEAIRNITQTLSMQLPIFKRSESEVGNALKHYQSQFDIFYKLR